MTMLTNYNISVIFPCYKVNPFLESIYNDITNQTITDSVEYIFVDDGGGECQARLLDELAEKDPRIKVVHKENGGVSSARNVGIIIASGKWIVFVDPDDRMKPDHLERL